MAAHRCCSAFVSRARSFLSRSYGSCSRKVGLSLHPLIIEGGGWYIVSTRLPTALWDFRTVLAILSVHRYLQLCTQSFLTGDPTAFTKGLPACFGALIAYNTIQAGTTRGGGVTAVAVVAHELLPRVVRHSRAKGAAQCQRLRGAGRHYRVGGVHAHIGFVRGRLEIGLGIGGCCRRVTNTYHGLAVVEIRIRARCAARRVRGGANAGGLRPKGLHASDEEDVVELFLELAAFGALVALHQAIRLDLDGSGQRVERWHVLFFAAEGMGGVPLDRRIVAVNAPDAANAR